MPAEINRPPILVKGGLVEIKDGYMLYKCPFCGTIPDQPDGYGYTVCKTKNCAIRGKPIKKDKWNRRAEIVDKKFTDTQQLKAEIAALLKTIYAKQEDLTFDYIILEFVIERLRQLSAI